MSDQPSNPGGRPLKFETVDELKQKIDEYFGSREPHIIKVKVKVPKADGGHYWADSEEMTEPQPITISGLARALGTTRETLLDYESGKYDDRDKDVDTNATFSDTIREAKMRAQEYAESQLFVGKNANGAAFALKNNYGWVDKQEIKHDAPNGLFGSEALTIRVINAGADSQPEATDNL